MFFRYLSLLQLIPLIFATPVPQDEGATFLRPSIATLPGVTITKGDVVATPSVTKNSYIIVLKDGINSSTISRFEDKVSKRIGKGTGKKYRIKPEQSGMTGFQAVQVMTDKNGLADIAKDPSVAFVELDAIASVRPIIRKQEAAAESRIGNTVGATTSTQVSNAGKSLWGLGRISHKKLGITNYVYSNTACKGSRIYVLDTGIRISHEQFRGDTTKIRRAVHGGNFVAGQPFEDENGHGTHCTGTAGGWTTGVCKQATIINVKVLGKDGSGSYSGIISGIQWAANDIVKNKAQKTSVLSLSLGGDYSNSLNTAIQDIINSGIPVVVAAGNTDQNVDRSSPASAPNALSVGATDATDTRTSFSNYGAAVDIFTLGKNISSAWAGSGKDYAWLDGTSQATPHVAGLAAYYMIDEKIDGVTAVLTRIINAAGKNMVKDAMGSQNRIAYNGNGQ